MSARRGGPLSFLVSKGDVKGSLGERLLARERSVRTAPSIDENDAVRSRSLFTKDDSDLVGEGGC
jgi:hypothetical protein